MNMICPKADKNLCHGSGCYHFKEHEESDDCLQIHHEGSCPQCIPVPQTDHTATIENAILEYIRENSYILDTTGVILLAEKINQAIGEG